MIAAVSSQLIGTGPFGDNATGQVNMLLHHGDRWLTGDSVGAPVCLCTCVPSMQWRSSRYVLGMAFIFGWLHGLLWCATSAAL